MTIIGFVVIAKPKATTAQSQFRLFKNYNNFCSSFSFQFLFFYCCCSYFSHNHFLYVCMCLCILKFVLCFLLSVCIHFNSSTLMMFYLSVDQLLVIPFLMLTDSKIDLIYLIIATIITIIMFMIQYNHIRMVSKPQFLFIIENKHSATTTTKKW